MAITTGKVRASYVNIFQPKVPEAGGDPKYSIMLLIPKTDKVTLDAIYGEIEKTKEEWSSKFGGIVPSNLRLPIHDGDGIKPMSGEPYGEECRGHMVMNASAYLQPSIVGLDMQPIINPAEMYSGCYIRANINFYSYNTKGNRGIGCGLNAVQKIEDGEPFIFRVSAEEAFGGSNSYSGMTGTYQQPQYAQPTQFQQPQYAQPAQFQQPQYAQPMVGQQIDPATGGPMMTGGIMGIG